MRKWKATIRNIEGGGPKNLALRRLFNDNLQGGAKTSTKPQRKKATGVLKPFACENCGKRYRGQSGVFYHKKKEHGYNPERHRRARGRKPQKVFGMPFYGVPKASEDLFMEEKEDLVFEDGGKLDDKDDKHFEDLESNSDLDSFDMDLDSIVDPIKRQIERDIANARETLGVTSSGELNLDEVPGLYMFRNLYNKGVLKVVAETKKFFAIVPSDGKSNPLPIDGTPGGPMSLIHILVCPKARIWNAVDVVQMLSFDREDALECARKAFDILVDSTDAWGLQTRLQQVKNFWSDSVSERPEYSQKGLERAKQLAREDVEFSFHLFPHNSVNHLHLHVWCPRLATKSYDLQNMAVQEKTKGVQETKNMPMQMVLDVIAEMAGLQGGGKRNRQLDPLPLKLEPPPKKRKLRHWGPEIIFQLDAKELSSVFGIDGTRLQIQVARLESAAIAPTTLQEYLKSELMTEKKEILHAFVPILPETSYIRNMLYIKHKSRSVQGTYGVTLMQCRFNGKKVVAKLSFAPTKVDDAFYETAINMLVSNAADTIDEVAAPKVHRFGWISPDTFKEKIPRRIIDRRNFGSQQTHSFVMVQDYVDGTTLYDCKENLLAQHLPTFFTGLGKLQEKFAFSHRDMHPGNLLLDRAGMIHIIDFGMACVTIPSSQNALQSFNIIREGDDSWKQCLNRSHDVCTLLMALAGRNKVDNIFFTDRYKTLIREIGVSYLIALGNLTQKSTLSLEEKKALETDKQYLVDWTRREKEEPFNYLIRWRDMDKFYLFFFEQFTPQKVAQRMAAALKDLEEREERNRDKKTRFTQMWKPGTGFIDDAGKVKQGPCVVCEVGDRGCRFDSEDACNRFVDSDTVESDLSFGDVRDVLFQNADMTGFLDHGKKRINLRTLRKKSNMSSRKRSSRKRSSRKRSSRRKERSPPTPTPITTLFTGVDSLGIAIQKSRSGKSVQIKGVFDYCQHKAVLKRGMVLTHVNGRDVRDLPYQQTKHLLQSMLLDQAQITLVWEKSDISRKAGRDDYIIKDNVYTLGKTPGIINYNARGNREFTLAALSRQGMLLKDLSQSLRDDPEIVRTAVNNNGLALQYASENLKNNKAIVELAVAQNRAALQYASEKWRNYFAGGGKYMASKRGKKKRRIKQIFKPRPRQKTPPRAKRTPLKQEDAALIYQLPPAELEDVFGIRAKVLQDTMSLLENNLDGTYAGINQILSKTIARKPMMWHQFVQSPLPEVMDDVVYIKEDSATASGSNGINLLECTLNGKRVAVKISFDATVTDAFYETLINMFVSHATTTIDEVSAPSIYRFGSIPQESVVAFATLNNIPQTFRFDANPVVIVQDYVPGKSLWKCTARELNRCLPTFFKGLAKMQKKFAFSHRDMHPNNLLLDENTGIVHIIDFGMACVTLPSTSDSIQSYQHTPGASSKRCLNPSHDVCTLLLALAGHAEFGYEHRILLQDISNRYKINILDVMKQPSRTEEEQTAVDATFMRRNIPPINLNTWTQIIHWHYLYDFYLFSFEQYAPQNIGRSL
jgi:serine/threonine protein kinase